MELLRSLAHLLYGLRKRTVPDFLSKATADSNNNVRQFAELLRKDKLLDDAEAAEHFYQASHHKTAYQKLKSKTRRALVGNLLRLDFYRMNLPERRRAFYEAHRDYAAIQILIGQRDRPAAVQLAKRTLKRTEKYEFTDLTVALLRFLRSHYGIQDTEPERSSQYHQRLLEAQRILALEDELEYLYFLAVGKYSFARAESGDAPSEATVPKVSLPQVPDLAELPSYRSLLTGTLIRSTLLLEQDQLQSAIECLDEAIQQFRTKPYLADGPLLMLYPQLVNLHLNVGAYPEAERAVAQVIQFLAKEDFNWFKFQEQRFLLLMHTERYEKAGELYQQVVGNANFTRMADQVIEVWGLFEAYLAFLVRVDQLSEDIGIRKFNSKRVQKNLKNFAGDKSGVNLSFRIIDMLFALQGRDEENLDNRIEALNRYRLRYLNQPKAERADLVVKILNLIAREIIENRVNTGELASLFEQLCRHDPQLEEREYAIEIIPYERLLGYVRPDLAQNT